jgi:two-component system cell cycle sensor histidine kinase/response regulator CckA
VYPATSGQEALVIYREKQGNIDLVILDMIMPVMTGSVVFKMLKEINKDVKVILASGYSMRGEVQKVMEMGCCGFIQKPYNFSELSNVVRQALYSECIDRE